MMIAKLIHPKLGVAAQEVVRDGYSINSIESRWQSKYGKKFKECQVVIEGQEPDLGAIKQVLVQNVRTGEIYNSKQEAADDLKVDITTIRNHLAKRVNPKEGRFLVRYL